MRFTVWVRVFIRGYLDTVIAICSEFFLDDDRYPQRFGNNGSQNTHTNVSIAPGTSRDDTIYFF
jgi:hypothetical protein